MKAYITTIVTTSRLRNTFVMRTLGNILILFSSFLLIRTLYQPVVEEILFFAHTLQNKSFVVEEHTPSLEETATLSAGLSPAPSIVPKQPENTFASLFRTNQVEVLVPTDPEFSLVIPKIGANAPIVANVDASSEDAYQKALENGIAHAQGTAFPGENRHIFLFAHSTDYLWNLGSYNAVFYLLYKLEPGDEVNIFYKGERYVYEAKERKIINPEDVEYLTRETDYEMVTLQTCWPPGTTAQRLIVTAERVD